MTTKKAIELDATRLLGFKVLGTGIFDSAAKVGGNKKTDTKGQKATVKSIMGSMVGKVGKRGEDHGVTSLEDVLGLL
ncbi:MAG: hypothetical protein DRR06_12085 [Gammaproteobacteria bacterium]|nr:MAG: hypothetical protein DRR06_12085 [Gammaproteobacteria bacterium]RLA51102.1 MAG: hypothetical protein DRR42_11255 [Gammaproteobacteria bacterium]